MRIEEAIGEERGEELHAGVSIGKLIGEEPPEDIIALCDLADIPLWFLAGM